ncbi:MarR family transcriptional regulator [Rhodobacterales bacterium HKCCE2091]|nr:MarR family transcriptional regulator [Rhodobacterales bacterium HKCCE2091]
MTTELARAGIAAGVADAALGIDAILQRWRRRAVKRELGLRAISDLGLSLDLPQLDALMAICAPRLEFDCAGRDETMVGTVAERLGIDPSRASRLTSDLIRLGLARRAVSQKDARRTILEPTTEGATVVHAVRMHKLMALSEYLGGWSEEDLARFLPLLERFTEWVDKTAEMPPARAAEIARLREGLKRGETG